VRSPSRFHKNLKSGRDLDAPILRLLMQRYRCVMRLTPETIVRVLKGDFTLGKWARCLGCPKFTLTEWMLNTPEDGGWFKADVPNGDDR
jgi:hypothetical protein